MKLSEVKKLEIGSTVSFPAYGATLVGKISKIGDPENVFSEYVITVGYTDVICCVDNLCLDEVILLEHTHKPTTSAILGCPVCFPVTKEVSVESFNLPSGKIIMSDKKLVVKVPTIYMDGGLIHGMSGFKPGEKVDVVDYDLSEIESSDDEICNCEAGDGEHYHNKITIDANGQY